MKVYNGSKYPIGGWQIENDRQYKSKIVDYNSGDVVYLGSDGFQDQFGGSNCKKYKSHKLHNFLKSNSQLPFNLQDQHLKKEFYNWKEDNLQTDDVCIVGIRL